MRKDANKMLSPCASLALTPGEDRLGHEPKKLTGYFDQNMLQLFDYERFLFDPGVPFDRETLSARPREWLGKVQSRQGKSGSLRAIRKFNLNRIRRA
jgi:hypothetical protein